MAKRSGATRETANPARRKVIGAAATLLLLPVFPRMARAASILAVRTWPADEYTRITLELDSELKAQQFLLDNPPRLVVDIEGLQANAALNELVSKVKPDDPYIKGLRVGQNRPDVVRIVFDLKQPIVPQVFTLKPVANYQYRLVLDLYPVKAQDPIMALLKEKSAGQDTDDPLARVLDEIAAKSANGAGAGTNTANAAQPANPATPPSSTATPAQPAITATPGAGGNAVARAPGAAGRKRMLTVAIDPGHGGEDPGATGRSGLHEKDVVLRIAQRLKQIVDAQPGMRAFLTRDSDYFVPLGVRVEKARRVQADLFMSIHADAFIRPDANGSSVFVLSENGASSTQARWLANQQNAADLIGGVNIGDHDQQVAKVLLDLSTTAQINDSLRVGSALLGELGKINGLHSGSVEHAGFAVLKAPDIPSVLVETAFISNPREESILRDPSHQDKFAQALFDGINSYFITNPPLARTIADAS